MAIERDSAAVVRRFWDQVWNRGDLSAIDDLVDDDFTNFGIRRQGGRAALRYIVTVWRTAFPDLSFEIEEEVALSDRVGHRVTARGTHLGEFQGEVGPGRIMGPLPPTNRRFQVDQIHIHHVRGERIVGHSATRNDLLMLSQLGLLPGVPAMDEAAWRLQSPA